MSALGWMFVGLLTRLAPTRGRGSRRLAKNKVVPRMESLEEISLLSPGCPVISGFVFLDENSPNPLNTDNGFLDPGEKGIPGASVALLDSTGKAIGTTSTAADGSYSFVSTNGQPANPNPAPVTTSTQTLTIGNPAQNTVLTNFSNQPLSPPLTLFDPTLGTLIGVTVSHAAILQSNITTTNLSTTSATTITAMVSGNYTISGLNAMISGSASAQDVIPNVPPFPDPGSTVTFPPLQANDAPPPLTFTDPASLAFFTSAPGRTTITPLMTANGLGTASAPGGNLSTTVTTSASATVNVSYTYIPPNNCLQPGDYTIEQTPEVPNVINGKESQNNTTVFPPNGPPQMLTVNLGTDDSIHNDFAKLSPNLCPTISSLQRVGVHNQSTQLILAFDGPVNPNLVRNLNNYSVITSTGQKIAIVSAVFDATTNSVVLTPAVPLNAHLHFRLSVTLPCPSGPSQLVPFGGKPTLIGFFNHQGQFVPITNGVIGVPSGTGTGTLGRHVVRAPRRHR